jgi:hypothetical protein
VPTYRLHDTTGDDLCLIERPAPNVEPGDVVVIPDGREALLTARVEAAPHRLLPRSRRGVGGDCFDQAPFGERGPHLAHDQVPGSPRAVTARTTRWIMVAVAVLSVVIAVAVPGYQFWLIIFGGVLVAWATFGLLTEE